MTLAIHVMDRTPGAENTVAWESVCHSAPFIMVRHQSIRSTGRWGAEERKRPFMVTHVARGGSGSMQWLEWSAHKTLDAAMKAAARAAKEV